MPVPFLPQSAPFSPSQRQWLNGYLAGMFSDANDGGQPAIPAEASAPKPRVPVLYGSQSGNSETLADEFSEKLIAAGFDAPVFGMDDIGDLALTEEKALCLVTSTWGEGDPPDNAIDFFNTLTGDDAPDLSSLSYSVLALGDSNYLEFCGAGKALDAAMEKCGAKRILDRVDCDVDFEEPAEEWFTGFLAAVKEAVPVAASSGASPAAPAPEKASNTYSKKNPFPAELNDNRRLNGEGTERDTRHFSLNLEGSGLTYEVGDVLGVVPQNCPEVVSELLTALGFDGEEPVLTPDAEEIAIRVALEKHYAITQPNKKFLDAFSEKLADEDFATLCADNQKLGEFLWGREIIDIIEAYPQVKFTPVEFVSILGRLSARLYSISSSPNAHPGEVHLTVASVRYDSLGRPRKGVCSTYLADRANGSGVGVFVQPAKHFKPPTDPAKPMIMVGPGTGIAPFRAFLEERKVTQAPGKNWLFFGNPHEESDFLYRDELTGFQSEGVLTRLDTAWSRDQEKKIYVQDKMREAGEELWTWLNEGGHFYVCGDAKRMAKDVDQALHDIASEHGGLSETEAADFIKQLKKDGRYSRDVY